MPEIAKKFKNFGEFAVQRLKELDNKSKSTVTRFMVQIRDLQHKVNSLNDAREFFDPETASSSGYPSFRVNP